MSIEAKLSGRVIDGDKTLPLLLGALAFCRARVWLLPNLHCQRLIFRYAKPYTLALRIESV